MNDVIKTIIERKTIRRYRAEQITEQELDAILEAGLYAPNAGGRQGTVIVASQDAALNIELGKINKSMMSAVLKQAGMSIQMGTVSAEQPSIIDDENIKSAFYHAPTVLTIFAPKDNYNFIGDAFVAAQNISLAAYSLGIGSCIIGRAIETFTTERGQEIQKTWGIDGAYEAKVHIVLGYPEGGFPSKAKARKNGRVVRV